MGAPRSRGEARRRFRVGIVGAGYISAYHLQVLRALPAVSVVAICDANARRALAAQQRWGVPYAASVAEMLSRADLDVVHVLAPPPYHAAVAAECLRAGCHVLVEKPIATSLEEWRALREAARRSGRTVGVNHNATYHPAFRQLVEAIRDRRLGAIENVVACWNAPLPQLRARQYGHWLFRAPGNVVLEQAVHPLSQIQLLMGAIRATSAFASGAVQLPTGQTFYQGWQAAMLCERGSAQCVLGFGREFRDSWLHVVGQDGSAFVDLRRNTLRISEKTSFVEPLDDLVDGLRSAAGIGRQAAASFGRYVLSFLGLTPRRDPYYLSMHASIEAYYHALAAGRSPPATLEPAGEILEACEAIVRSGMSQVADAQAPPTPLAR